MISRRVFSYLLLLTAFLVVTCQEQSAPVSYEVIVYDSLGQVETLTVAYGTSASVKYINTTVASTISIYTVWVVVHQNSAQSFYIQQSSPPVLFGQASLLSAGFSSTFSLNNTLLANNAIDLLGTAQLPESTPGLYQYIFAVPSSQFVSVNIFYQANTTTNGQTIESDCQISLNIFNPVILSSVQGDPSFVGLRGQIYQVHGIDGGIYNIISQPDTQVNCEFVFLSKGTCPVLNGTRQQSCWSHSGSYLGTMSFQTQSVNKTIHQALVEPGSATRGFKRVTFNNIAVHLHQYFKSGNLSLYFENSHSIVVHTQAFQFRLSNSDMFLNQAVTALVPLSLLQPCHGLLGQTASAKIYPTTTKYIEGRVDDYLIKSGSIFGNQFMYNLFR